MWGLVAFRLLGRGGYVTLFAREGDVKFFFFVTIHLMSSVRLAEGGWVTFVGQRGGVCKFYRLKRGVNHVNNEHSLSGMYFSPAKSFPSELELDVVLDTRDI